MKLALIGGDERMKELALLLHGEGQSVTSYGLERAELPKDIPKAQCIQGCCYGADVVVLPTPAEIGGLIQAPLSLRSIRSEELLSALWAEQLLVGGKLSDQLTLGAARQGLQVVDVLGREDFAVGNAAITAEGAVHALMSCNGKTLLGSRVLLCGWGRIARLLAPKLCVLGASVTVVARAARDRAFARAEGMAAFDFPALGESAPQADFVVNTVPARVIADRFLCSLADGTVLLELASAPGGFDRKLAENIGLKVLTAPGLPGSYAPRAAAAVLRDCIDRLVEERMG